jgi:hypothetical protein
LERVVGVVHRAEHPVAVSVKLGPVRPDEPAKGMTVAAAGALEQGPLLGDEACHGDRHAASLKTAAGICPAAARATDESAAA